MNGCTLFQNCYRMMQSGIKSRFSFIALLIATLAGCASYCDDSCFITDDQGFLHRSIHYTEDKRGRDYFPLTLTATGKKHFIFDPKVFAWAAYDELGNRVMTGSASGGKDFCEDVKASCRTVTGTFRVYHKKGIECRSGEYPVETTGGAKMPYCMYFFRGYTIHAAFEVPSANSSHGCVRVFPSAAKWLNEQFITLGTQVTIMPY